MNLRLGRFVPTALPQSEPHALAQAVLSPGPGRRVARTVPETVSVAVLALNLLGGVLAAVAQNPWPAVGCFIVGGAADWAASGGTGRVAQLLQMLGWGEALRSLLRWLLLLAALRDSGWLVLVPVAVQAAAFTAVVVAQWLFQRQPPLEYLPGGTTQPTATRAYARVYGRAARWPGALLAVELAAAVLAVTAPAWSVLAALAALGYAAWLALAGLRLGASAAAVQDDLEQRLDRATPDCAVYVSGGVAQAKYLFNPWVVAFDALPAPPVVIVREANQLAVLAPSSGHVVYAPASRHVETLCRPSVRVAFYLANGQKNGDLWRNPALKHVFLGHGDSDKATSASPIAKVYDEIWVAGPSAVDRYRRAGIALPDSAFVVVGRPQVAELPVGPTGHETPVVLYAPTFEGYAEATNYSSLAVFGADLVRALLEHRPELTVWFRPHPSTGVQRADIRAAREQVNVLLRAAGGPHRVLDDEPAESLQRSMAGADLLITDVSSVSSDFLQTGRPIIVTNPGRLPTDEFIRRFPAQEAAYLIGEAAELPDALDAALGADPLAAARLELKRRVLGDLPEGPIAAFVAASRRLAAGRVAG